MAFRAQHTARGRRRPRILIFACYSYNIGRIPRELQRAGAEVAVLCPSDAPLAATRYAHRRYALPEQRDSSGMGVEGRRLAFVLARLRPDIVIPGDERAFYVMIGLERRLGPLTEKLLLGSANALRRSLRSEEHTSELQSPV